MGQGEITFGVAIPGQTVHVRVDGAPGATWWEVLKDAYEQLTATKEGRAYYGDPSTGGATIEQAWRTQFAITGALQVCLLKEGEHKVSTAAIPRTLQLTADELISSLSRAVREPGHACQTFIFDGKAGHCVVLTRYDESGASFIYFDPWPESSFLCSGNNSAGVAAEPEEPRHWRVTKEDLRKVIFAAFIWPSTWADLEGIAYEVPYAELTKSEFWSFFHLRQTDQRLDDYGTKHFAVEPGGYQDAIDMQFQVEPKGRVIGATLALKRAWLLDAAGRINPLSADLTRSFLSALTPAPDREDCEPFILGLRALEGWRLDALPDPSSAAGRFLQAFMGTEAESNAVMTFLGLRVESLERETGAWVKLDLTLW